MATFFWSMTFLLDVDWRRMPSGSQDMDTSLSLDTADRQSLSLHND
jgi:hypothetical protein